MRLATIIEHEREVLVAVAADRVLQIEPPLSMNALAGAASAEALDDIRIQLTRLKPDSHRWIDRVRWAPAVPDPGAIYTIGANYRSSGASEARRPERPMVLAKLPSSVAGHGATVGWDRSLTANVDGECELGVVIGRPAFAVAPEDAMEHVFGYTIVNDMNSVDPWLDGDQWLLGKSLPGFCPVGPWVVTADELDPADLRLGCTINGVAIQDGRTADMKFSIAEIVAYISRHVPLRPGDLIATGTPARLAAPPGPDRHLQPGDTVTAWIEGIGELTTTIA
jgi:2-keto-4-pentenoate hydratase/2-oxohepta-3-ene-1,7-dioic acid hydratase in catechol pathway